MNITKILTRDKTYVRPKTTYQDSMTNKEINDKLKDYKIVTNILQVPINTHVRYFTTDKSGKTVFRLGGTITKYGENQKYLVLSNGTLSWSVQIANSKFYQKMSESEIKNEIRKELITECEGSITKENKEIEHENKELKKENKNLLKKLEHLNDKIRYIEETIKKERHKVDNMDCKKKKKKY